MVIKLPAETCRGIFLAWPVGCRVRWLSGIFLVGDALAVTTWMIRRHGNAVELWPCSFHSHSSLGFEGDHLRPLLLLPAHHGPLVHQRVREKAAHSEASSIPRGTIWSVVAARSLLLSAHSRRHWLSEQRKALSSEYRVAFFSNRRAARPRRIDPGRRAT